MQRTYPESAQIHRRHRPAGSVLPHGMFNQCRPEDLSNHTFCVFRCRDSDARFASLIQSRLLHLNHQPRPTLPHPHTYSFVHLWCGLGWGPTEERRTRYGKYNTTHNRWQATTNSDAVCEGSITMEYASSFCVLFSGIIGLGGEWLGDF